MHDSICVYSIITSLLLTFSTAIVWGQDPTLHSSIAAENNVSLYAFGHRFDEAKDQGAEPKGRNGCCDCAKAATSSHKGLFYANNFDYLCNSCGSSYLGDCFKRLAVGNCWTVDVGGQYRLRFHSEKNISNDPAGDSEASWSPNGS